MQLSDSLYKPVIKGHISFSLFNIHFNKNVSVLTKTQNNKTMDKFQEQTDFFFFSFPMKLTVWNFNRCSIWS